MTNYFNCLILTIKVIVIFALIITKLCLLLKLQLPCLGRNVVQNWYDIRKGLSEKSLSVQVHVIDFKRYFKKCEKTIHKKNNDTFTRIHELRI